MSRSLLAATDDDVRALDASTAVALMFDAVRAHGLGELQAPTRVTTDFGDAAFISTAGRWPGEVNGFRLTSTVPETAGDFTVVLSAGSAEPELVLGRDLGRRRTGALGGVAAALCSRTDSTRLGIIGAGEQAFTQLWAIAAVRRLGRIRLVNRSTERRDRFIRRAREELGVAVEPAVDADDVAADSDILVLATGSPVPLVSADAVAPGTHVHTLGPKGQTLGTDAAGECPRELVARADLFVSDSPDQLVAMQGAHRPWSGAWPVTSLGAIATGRAPGRLRDRDISVYASVGLAGTEVLLARAVLRRLQADALAPPITV